MKILCISDTHGLHKKIKEDDLPPADVIVHSGDVCNTGNISELNYFLNWYASLEQYTHKIFIAGNHDFALQDYPEIVAKLPINYPNITYLRDSAVTIDGVKFYGSPWQPWFYDWAFNLQRGVEIRDKWDLIPEDTNVLITHGPPHGYGDMVPSGIHVGCEDLLQVIRKDLLKLEYHIFGHIHHSYGATMTHSPRFINASICDEGYRPINKPILIEI